MFLDTNVTHSSDAFATKDETRQHARLTVSNGAREGAQQVYTALQVLPQIAGPEESWVKLPLPYLLSRLPSLPPLLPATTQSPAATSKVAGASVQPPSSKTGGMVPPRQICDSLMQRCKCLNCCGVPKGCERAECHSDSDGPPHKQL